MSDLWSILRHPRAIASGDGSARVPRVAQRVGVVEFELVRRFGVRILEDPELDVDVCYVGERRLAIVRAGLDDFTRAWCADWLLSEALLPTVTTT